MSELDNCRLSSRAWCNDGAALHAAARSFKAAALVIMPGRDSDFTQYLAGECELHRGSRKAHIKIYPWFDVWCCIITLAKSEVFTHAHSRVCYFQNKQNRHRWWDVQKVYCTKCQICFARTRHLARPGRVVRSPHHLTLCHALSRCRISSSRSGTCRTRNWVSVHRFSVQNGMNANFKRGVKWLFRASFIACEPSKSYFWDARESINFTRVCVGSFGDLLHWQFQSLSVVDRSAL